MSGIDTQVMTLREIALYCKCSKIPVKKQLERLQLANATKVQNGKTVTAYKLTKLQLESIKENIANNKGGLPVADTIIDNHNQTENVPKPIVNTAYQELMDKYMEVKSLYDIANTTQKLLEDRQGESLTKLNELQKEKEVLISEKATLESDLRHKESEIRTIVESKDKTINSFKHIAIGMGIVAVVLLLMLLFLVIIKVGV